MGKLRPCPFCKGYHRTKKSARACGKRNIKAKPWTKAELGL